MYPFFLLITCSGFEKANPPHTDTHLKPHSWYRTGHLQAQIYKLYFAMGHGGMGLALWYAEFLLLSTCLPKAGSDTPACSGQ